MFHHTRDLFKPCSASLIPHHHCNFLCTNGALHADSYGPVVHAYIQCAILERSDTVTASHYVGTQLVHHRHHIDNSFTSLFHGVLLQIGPLVAGLSSRPAQHQAICLRVAVAALEHFPAPQGSSIPAETSPLMLQKFPFLGSKEVCDHVTCSCRCVVSVNRSCLQTHS